MSKSLIMIAAALVILSAGLSDRAQAGASASAPTKYSRASSAGYQAWTGWLHTRRATGTSEYSSSNRSRRR